MHNLRFFRTLHQITQIVLVSSAFNTVLEFLYEDNVLNSIHNDNEVSPTKKPNSKRCNPPFYIRPSFFSSPHNVALPKVFDRLSPEAR